MQVCSYEFPGEAESRNKLQRCRRRLQDRLEGLQSDCKGVEQMKGGVTQVSRSQEPEPCGAHSGPEPKLSPRLLREGSKQKRGPRGCSWLQEPDKRMCPHGSNIGRTRL